MLPPLTPPPIPELSMCPQQTQSRISSSSHRRISLRRNLFPLTNPFLKIRLNNNTYCISGQQVILNRDQILNKSRCEEPEALSTDSLPHKKKQWVKLHAIYNHVNILRRGFCFVFFKLTQLWEASVWTRCLCRGLLISFSVNAFSNKICSFNCFWPSEERYTC